MNKMLKTLVYGGQMSVAVLDTTDMVNEAIRIHKLSPTAAAALGRTLTACTYMSGCLKSENDKLSITVAGDGIGGKITVCGNGALAAGSLQPAACAYTGGLQAALGSYLWNTPNSRLPKVWQPKPSASALECQ